MREAAEAIGWAVFGLGAVGMLIFGVSSCHQKSATRDAEVMKHCIEKTGDPKTCYCVYKSAGCQEYRYFGAKEVEKVVTP